MGRVKPSAVEVAAPNPGLLALPVIEAYEEEVAVPVSYPVRLVVIVTVDEVPGFTPVTVIKPVPAIETVPPREFVPDHVYAASKLESCN